jgi:hypothetical protein
MANTPVTTVRLPVALLALITEYLRKRELHSTVAPWTMTDFLIAASRELLRKKAWRKPKHLFDDLVPPPCEDEELVNNVMATDSWLETIPEDL